MRQCCIKVKNVRKRRKRKLILLSALLLIIFVVYLFVTLSVRPIIRTVSQEFIRALTVETVNLAVDDVMENNPAYVHLTEIEKDEQGNITLITTNSAAVNSLARKVTEKAQSSLEIVAEQGIGIPLGSLSGISFFSGRGPEVNIKAIPIGNIDTTFSSEFIPAGINQTLHKLFINIAASINIVIPGAQNKISVLTQVMIGETIIIGKVPNFYFGSQTPLPTLNLVP